ncbi:MAG: glycosyltransferase family 4 protein [Chloroflexota bacterium]
MQEAQTLGINHLVQCVGHVNDPADLSHYFRQADIFLLLSAAEGFPRVVNEALLHSLPVVVTPVGGIPDELVENEHALFVPVDSPSDAAKAITRLVVEAPPPAVNSGRLSLGHRTDARASLAATCQVVRVVKVWICR